MQEADGSGGCPLPKTGGSTWSATSTKHRSAFVMPLPLVSSSGRCVCKVRHNPEMLQTPCGAPQHTQ